jgi:hypothetical protein
MVLVTGQILDGSGLGDDVDEADPIAILDEADERELDPPVHAADAGGEPPSVSVFLIRRLHGGILCQYPLLGNPDPADPPVAVDAGAAARVSCELLPEQQVPA